MTKQVIQQLLKESMLAKNAEKTSVLRMLLSAVTYYEIQKGGAGYVATEEDILAVTQKEAKQRKDAIAEYQKAQRTDLADKEQRELHMLQEFLPAQMGKEEIQKLVDQAITQTGAKTPAELGKVMGILMPQTKGKADGSLVSQLVRETLGK